MNESDAKRFRKRFIFSATRKGFSEFSEDLAHDSLIKWLEGRGKHQTVDQATVDAIRGAFGRPGSPNYQLKRNVTRPSGSLDAVANKSSGEVLGYHDYDLERIIETLNSSDRAIAVLIYVWGFKELEVGHCFGVTESRISQRLKGIQEKLSREMAREKQREVENLLGELPENGVRETISEETMEKVLREKVEGMEFEAHFGMAEEKFWAMEIANEESFPEWFA